MDTGNKAARSVKIRETPYPDSSPSSALWLDAVSSQLDAFLIFRMRYSARTGLRKKFNRIMKRFAVAGVVLLAVLVGWILSRRPGSAPPAEPPVSIPVSVTDPGASPGITAVSTPSPPGADPADPQPLIGEEMLRDYGDPAMSPRNDLSLLAGLLTNMGLLVKNVYDRPMSDNADWATALLGKNPAQERFLPGQHRVLNADGLLVDRWETPLFFHPLSKGRYEIRSAGPDRKMWTEDDLHRNSDGTFRTESDLNAAGLFETPPHPLRN